MSDISFTAANVVAVEDKGINPVILPVTLGATGTAGQAVYEDGADGDQAKPADATTAAKAAAVGILLNGGADEQPGFVLSEGVLDFGGGITPGVIYVVSPNVAGGIAPSTDLGSGDYVTTLGVGISSREIYVRINASGVAKP